MHTDVLIYFREYKTYTHIYRKYNKKQILLEREILLEKIEIEWYIFSEKNIIKIYNEKGRCMERR